MSTNNFLSNLLSSSNRSPKSRSSSLFASSRQLPLFTSLANREQQKKNRSSSVSKLLENKNNPNELIKWTPLIKTVHKLGAKMKKQYFFFWCRMEAYVKAKHGISIKDIKQIIEHKQSNLALNQEITQKVQQKIEQQLDKNIEAQTNNHQKIINQPKAQNQQIKQTQVKKQEINSDECSSQKQQLDTTVLSQFVISLSKAMYRIGQINLKAAFKEISVKSRKVKAIEKLKDISFRAHTKNSQYSVIRTLKKNSHYIIKIEILGNTLKSLIRKWQHNDLKYCIDLLKQKTASFQHKKEEKPKLSTVSIEPEFCLHTKVPAGNIIQAKQKQSSDPQGQTPRFTFNSNQKKPQLPSPFQENPHIVQSIKTNDNTISNSKPLTIMKINQAKPLYLKSQCHNKAILKQTIQDKGLVINYFIQSQRDNERMKKLNRLYVEEPLYQLPDISQITLFDATINSPQIFSNIISNANQSYKCKQHQSSISTQTQRSEPEPFIFSQEEQSAQFQQYKISSSISPQMSPRFQKKCQQIQNDESQQLKNVISQEFCLKDKQYKNEDLNLKKSPSCTLTLTKNPSSSQINSKSINLKTPVSSKKYIDPFTKKRSIDILVKMPSDTKKCQSKLFTNNSAALLKRFDVQIKEESKKKVSQAQKINSKQKYHLSYATVSGKKPQKSRQKQEKTVNYPHSALKQNYHSIHSGLKENYNLTPKLIERSIDLSSKKNVVKTSQKKENKENYSNELFKSSSKKVLTKKNSSKQNKLSEFNEVNSSAKIIKYNDFMKKCSSTKGQQQINRAPLKQIQKNNDNDPTFQPIHLTQQDYGSKQLQLYETVSAQFVKDKTGQLNKQKQKSTRLRTKIDKIQLNTARKMKLQIESMINQRKKTSMGLLKF